MTDADVHTSDSEEPTYEFDHVTVENDHAPNECAIFPHDVSEDVLMTTWISAHDDSFVDLETMR
ncbi:DUF7511 domain-containing protein [Natrinema halophilum]|uniref:DUF7511 domain-containing protein n=1 Tax=Natrinema halophilum TaxID=1699371 RepID=A0A7D5KTA3_9EURY|nr:hypothetical protein [Natrinema halophilum]QLG50304.1 hypothetical protein HYG82_16375 [Natrinema halophilum]